MYEQSIPALAYIFIGITSLVVTYSQINQKDNVEDANTNTSDSTEPTESNEPVSNTIEEPQRETAAESTAQENSELPEQQTDNAQPDENSVPLNKSEEENKVGGRKTKKKPKRKSTKSIKKIVKKNKRKSLRKKT